VGEPARYWELRLTVAGDTSEALTNFLWEAGALGVMEEELPGAEPALRAFFPDTAVPARLAEHVTAYAGSLAALGFTAAGRPHVAVLEDTGWADAWREHFRPRAIGRRFVVTPPWETPEPGDRLALIIEPGRAFGTGHHGSTAGCLEAIERLAIPDAPAYAIDLGTGSGILAVALARLGTRRILAVDDDPDAAAAAAANAARNDASGRIECLVADVAQLAAPPAPLVVANILTTAHRRLAAHYGTLVVPHGALVLGGILDGEAVDVEHALRGVGWDVADTIRREGWATLVFRR
jgi:ribosomal protein L11 methyltransferase